MDLAHQEQQHENHEKSTTTIKSSQHKNYRLNKTLKTKI